MIVAIIQARMSSTRLPGKVLMDICGKPALLWTVERLRGCHSIDRIVVATSTDPSDDPIAKFCEVRGVSIYRGDLVNVLSRFVGAIDSVGLDDDDDVIRITADCPLIVPSVVEQVIECHHKSASEYTSNINPPTYPDGLDTEIFKAGVLRGLLKKDLDKEDLEHVTIYIRSHLESYRYDNLHLDQDYSKCRVTLDTYEDFQRIERMILTLGVDGITLEAILQWFDAHESRERRLL